MGWNWSLHLAQLVHEALFESTPDLQSVRLLASRRPAEGLHSKSQVLGVVSSTTTGSWDFARVKSIVCMMPTRMPLGSGASSFILRSRTTAFSKTSSLGIASMGVPQASSTQSRGVLCHSGDP